MKSNNLTLLEQDLIRLKRAKIFNIGKNAFIFSFFSILSPIASKAIGLGYPFLIDVEKCYTVSVDKIDNLGNRNTISKDVLESDLYKYRDFNNKIYVYNYIDINKREVLVYEVDYDIDNYKEVISNYQDYIDEGNVDNNYIEYISNSFNLEDINISVEYIDICENPNGNKEENLFVNLFVTMSYLGLVLGGGYICRYSICNNIQDINDEIEYIKRKKRLSRNK